MKRDDVSHLEWKSDVQAAHAGQLCVEHCPTQLRFSSLNPFVLNELRSIMSNGGCKQRVRVASNIPKLEQGIRKVDAVPDDVGRVLPLGRKREARERRRASNAVVSALR